MRAVYTSGKLMKSAHYLYCTRMRVCAFASLNAPVFNTVSENECCGKNRRRKRLSQPARKLMERGERVKGRVKRKRLSTSNKFRGINVQTSPDYPREHQTQSSSTPQFKGVTRPLEFLILIASTGLWLQCKQQGRLRGM